jgi:uncharacterized protein with FMN-binding domain
VAKKISNGLLTLSSAAILAVYAAGYERTNPAAERFEAQLAQRRAPLPVVERLAAAPTPPAAVLPTLPSDVKTRPEPRPEATVPNRKAPTAAAEEPNQPPVVSETSIPAPAIEPAPVAPVAPISTAPVAETAADHPQAPAAAPQPHYKDGVYLAWGYSRHGNIQAFVRIEGGRIINAGIERCETRWSCDLVAHLPGQVIKRQSAEVDFVSGATQSGDAFYGAIFNALAQAK